MRKITTGTMPGMKNQLTDVSNNIATTYVEEHYDEIIVTALKMGIADEKAQDMVHDVYLSLVRAEENGEGYRIDAKDSGEAITVEQFIYGRLKGYSKNIRYAKGKYNKYEIPASGDSDTKDERIIAIKQAYENATDVNEIEEVDMRMTVMAQVEYIREFDNCGLNMGFVLEHIAELARAPVGTSLFEGVSRKVRKDRRFAEALTDIFRFAGRHPDDYQAMLRLG